MVLSSPILSESSGLTSAPRDSLKGMQEVREDKREPGLMYVCRAGCGTKVALQRQEGVSAFGGVASGVEGWIKGG
jgi:hypothetical protein